MFLKQHILAVFEYIQWYLSTNVLFWCYFLQCTYQPLFTLLGVGHNNYNYCNSSTLRPRQNGRHFADDIFKHIFLNK